jgi:palmitoyltransferase
LRGDKNKSTGSVFADKGMAIACLGLVLGLVFMFTHAVVLADGMPNMDVHAAGWAWLVVLTSGYGLYLMFKVTTADPGFADAKDAAAVLDTRVRSSKRDGGALRRHEAQNGAHSQSGSTVWDEGTETGQVFDASSRANAYLEHPELKAGNWAALCPTCKIVKPWGTKHCGTTNKCVKRFDHYCPWMGNVIGKGNHRDFVFFLILETLAMAIAFAVAVARLRQAGGAHTQAPFTVTYITVFMVLDGCVLFPVLFLTAAQIGQVLRNITTNELANAHRYHYLRDANGKFHNPFDKGIAANVKSFLKMSNNEAQTQRETVMSAREMEGILSGSENEV